MNSNTLRNLKSQFVAQVVGHELMLVPLTAHVKHMNEMFTLNETGRFIWEHLDQLDAENSIDALAKSIATHFDIDVETAKSDLEDFLSRLIKIIPNIER